MKTRRMIGRTIGHFVIRELLGRGSMASVYRAEHRVLGHSVALKILHERHLHNETMMRRFINEARTMSAIQHPGIVAIHDIGRTTDGRVYIVMELLHGESLRQRIDAGRPMSEARTVKLARQIASALAAAHAYGVIHRDVKPDNIFLVPDPEVPGGERVKVLDFGIAKLTGEGHGELTAVGIVLGTPAYMAPEQCTPNRSVDARADIYSLGALMYRMVTGQNVFSSSDEIEILRSHIHMAPPRPSECGVHVSAGFEAAVMTCLSKDPDARFQSMLEFMGALTELEAAAEISGPSSAPYVEQAIPRVHGTQRTATLAFDPMDSPATDSGARIRLPLPAQHIELTGVDITFDELIEVTMGRSQSRLVWSALGGLGVAALIILLTTLLG